MRIKHLLHKLEKSAFIISLIALFWFLFRTGTRPTRLAYPCQRIAAAQSISYFGYIVPFIYFRRFMHLVKHKNIYKTLTFIFILFILVGFASFAFDKFNYYQDTKEFNQHKLHPALGLSSITGLAISSQDFPSNRVVSVHDSDATNWDHSSSMHWQFIDQATVTNMMDRGVMQLTGTSTRQDAWNAIIPTYQTGDDIAIKLNFNNAWSCGGADDNEMDGYSETVNAVILGLKSINVPEDNIWFYDAMSRAVPNRFINRIIDKYPNVRFYGATGTGPCNGRYFTTSFVSPTSSYVSSFTCPYGNLPSDVIRPAQVLVDAEHLINIPLFKSHGSYVTLALKNHYGSVTYNLNTRQTMHDYFNEGGNDYNCPLDTQNVLADINNNPQIRDKTRLIIGDGLYGNQFCNWCNPGPVRWPNMFSNDDPNILFFSVDPVAISSVMTDYIVAERGSQDHQQLHAASTTYNLGVHEHWNNPTNKQYTSIDYQQIDVDAETCTICDLTNAYWSLT